MTFIILSFRYIAIVISFLLPLTLSGQQSKAIPCYEEIGGLLSVEAEHFAYQTLDSIRKWHIVAEEDFPSRVSKNDERHLEGAGNGAYLELLPDTRVTHDDNLVHGENFSDLPGKLALLHYYVYINNPGKYYVWVRTQTTGTEDNSIHVGLDGTWPSSGERMQFDGNKNQWSWESRQRTKAVHTGVPELIFLDITRPGYHTVSFSMREDGFKFDKWALTKIYKQPQGMGPQEKLKL